MKTKSRSRSHVRTSVCLIRLYWQPRNSWMRRSISVRAKMSFSAKKILLGITGSIAAYKAIYLVRLLTKAGAEVKVIITPSARDFVSELTLSTLSRNPVLSNLSDEKNWANHVELGR